MKLTNIRVYEGHAALRADVETETGEGWVEHWFEEDYQEDEVTDGEIDCEILEAAHAALGEYYEQTIKPHYVAMVAILNEVCKGHEIVVDRF